MHKIVISAPGSYDRLQVKKEQIPPPKPGEVLVRNYAAGVNYADCVIRMGLYQSAKEFVGWPITPGFEFAGTVAGLGSGVKDLAIGDNVFGVTRFGAYASHLLVPRHQLFSLPTGLSLLQASAFPAVFLTAYYPLHELTRLRPGQSVLIHSAAGGVGGALVQLAKLAGCRVAGVVGGPHKIEAARALGADVVIEKSSAPVWQLAREFSPGGYDMVLDANGVSTLKASYEHLAPGGKLVIYGFHSMLPKSGGRPNYLKLAWDYLRTPRFNPLSLTNQNRSILAFNLSYLFDREEILAEAMKNLTAWLTQGKLRPLAVKPYPFKKVADAHRALESGQTTGKLALVFD